jgi:hypothetical protein
MRRLIPLALAAALLAAPATAQEAEQPGLLDQGLESLLQNFAQDVQPPLEELLGISATYLGAIQGFLEEMGPAFAEVVGQVDSFAYYEPPEITAAGDIVIRRRADAPAWTPLEPGAEASPDAAPETAPDSEPDAEPAPQDEGGGWFDFWSEPEATPQDGVEL